MGFGVWQAGLWGVASTRPARPCARPAGTRASRGSRRLSRWPVRQRRRAPRTRLTRVFGAPWSEGGVVAHYSHTLGLLSTLTLSHSHAPDLSARRCILCKCRIFRRVVACQLFPATQAVLMARPVDLCGCIFITESLILPSLPSSSVVSWRGTPAWHQCGGNSGRDQANRGPGNQGNQGGPGLVFGHQGSGTTHGLGRCRLSAVARRLPVGTRKLWRAICLICTPSLSSPGLQLPRLQRLAISVFPPFPLFFSIFGDTIWHMMCILSSRA